MGLWVEMGREERDWGIGMLCRIMVSFLSVCGLGGFGAV